MVLAPEKFVSKGPPPPAFIGWLFAIIGGTIIAVGWIFAGFIATAGRFLAKRRHYLFCLIVAGVECLVMPYGTVLGVFTLMVLMRPSVNALFAANRDSRRPR